MPLEPFYLSTLPRAEYCPHEVAAHMQCCADSEHSRAGAETRGKDERVCHY